MRIPHLEQLLLSTLHPRHLYIVRMGYRVAEFLFVDLSFKLMLCEQHFLPAAETQAASLCSFKQVQV